MKSDAQTSPNSPGALKAWTLASRPRTWIASISPVLIGAAFAEQGDLLLLALTLLFALLIQIGTNFANDACDFLKGADTAERVGPKRATQQGWIAAKEMFRGALITFALAFMAALPLMLRAGWWSFSVCAVCILLGLTYTGGPKPFGYLGLGELFVFIFFGPVATVGAYFLQTLQIHPAAMLVGFGPGLFSCALLIANNLRDESSDRTAGKKTLVVRFGKAFGWWEYRIALALAAGVPIALVLCYGASQRLWYAPLSLLFTLLPKELLQKTAMAFIAYTLLICWALMW